jgi:hypothetical protein
MKYNRIHSSGKLAFLLGMFLWGALCITSGSSARGRFTGCACTGCELRVEDHEASIRVARGLISFGPVAPNRLNWSQFFDTNVLLNISLTLPEGRFDKHETFGGVGILDAAGMLSATAGRAGLKVKTADFCPNGRVSTSTTSSGGSVWHPVVVQCTNRWLVVRRRWPRTGTISAESPRHCHCREGFNPISPYALERAVDLYAAARKNGFGDLADFQWKAISGDTLKRVSVAFCLIALICPMDVSENYFTCGGETPVIFCWAESFGGPWFRGSPTLCVGRLTINYREDVMSQSLAETARVGIFFRLSL